MIFTLLLYIKLKNTRKKSIKETLNLRLVDSHKNPLKYQEFRLFEVIAAKRYPIDKIFITDEKGECSLNTKEIFQDKALSFELKLNYSSYYKDKSIFHYRRLLRNYEYGHWCEFKFERKVDNFSIKRIELKPKKFTLDNNEKIIRNFHKNGDILEFEAFYDKEKIKEEDIKWGYVFIKRSEILDKLNKNQLTNDKKESSLFDEEILKDCCQIENINNKIALSNSLISRLEGNPRAYCGKTIKITLPQYNISSQEQQALLIFAYKDTPNYRASQLIRINDYPQITIDCTLAQTLRAHTKQDEISRLGWGVSYICQRLWHDNPSNATKIDELTYIHSHQQDFINSIPNKTMQDIVQNILPKVEIKEFANDIGKECPKVKAMAQKNAQANLRFYVELDWDEFYMKFPLMKGLEEEMLNIQLEPITYGFQGIPNPILPTYNGKILTKGFLTQIQNFINSKKDIIKEIKDDKSTMQVTANLLEIAKNPKEANISNANNKIFSITADSTNLQECEKILDDIKPIILRRNQMQYYGISDTSFGKEYLFSFKEKSNQAIALYALSGKFQIYYVLDKFEVEKMSDNTIAIYPIQIKAYVDDSFDFIDKPNQTVGVWGYEKIEFDLATSFAMLLKYWWNREINEEEQIQLALKYHQNRDNNLNRGVMYYHLYNFDYQNTQKHFNLGCDFLVTSKSFNKTHINTNSKIL